MQAVKTALRVLEGLAGEQPIGLSALARRLALPKTTVHRALVTLAEMGWVRSDQGVTPGWTLTAKAFSIGSEGINRQQLRRGALPVLNALRTATLETVHLMIPDGDDVVLVERLDSAHALRTFTPLGTRNPLHAGANGKSILALSSQERIGRYLATSLDSVTEHTITDEQELRAELVAIKTRGYAVNNEELVDGIVAVGAAVCDSDGVPIASISVSAPKSRMSAALISKYGPEVRAGAEQIAVEMNNTSWSRSPIVS